MAPILECKELTKVFGGVEAVSGLSVTVEPGRVVGLFGVKGSGKTTLLKLAAGLLTPDRGSVLIEGRKPGIETKRVTAFMPDAESFEDRSSVSDAIRFYRDFYADFDENRAVESLSSLGIDRKEKISDLSKGSAVKLRLALTLSRRARLYLLDDPVAGTDIATVSYALNTIATGRPEGSSVIIASQTPSDVERVITDAAFISGGGIVLFEDAEKLRAEKGKSVNSLFTEEFKC